MYSDHAGTTCYGWLQKLLILESDEELHAIAVILRFQPAVQKLCKDSVTNAMLDDHITMLQVPRLVLDN